MPTESIKKNIVIKVEKSGEAFVEALEKAEAIATKPAPRTFEVKKLKSKEELKAVFGEKMEHIV